MAIEYIGEVTLKAPQHIEDKLAALAEKATQGQACISEKTAQEMTTKNGQIIASFWERADANLIEGSLLCFTEECEANTALHVALHNAAPALLAVVRAARALNGAHDPSHRVVTSMQLASALAALDAVEV